LKGFSMNSLTIGLSLKIDFNHEYSNSTTAKA